MVLSLALLTAAAVFTFQGCSETRSEQLKEEHARLTSAPLVRSPFTRTHPTKVIVDSETTEETKKTR